MSNWNRFLRTSCVLMYMLFCAWTLAQAQSSPADLSGSWQGTLGAGTVKLRLVLTFTRAADGQYNAILDSLDQGATIPCDKVTLNGDKLRIDVGRVNGFYEGVINKEAGEI